MQLPRKLQSGDWFKPSTFRTVNGIIDYLATQRVVGDNQTIKVSQQNTGLTISAIPNPYGGSATITAVVLPFKLTVTDNNGTQVLAVEKGIVKTAISQLIFDYNNLDLPTADGIYKVYGYIQYNGSNFANGVFLIDSTKTVAKTRGFYAFEIGTIEVTTVDSVATYTITEQTAKSDIEIVDYQLFQPFCAYCYNDTTLHNTIQTDNVIPNSFNINSGNLFISSQSKTINSLTGSGNGYIYLVITITDSDIQCVLTQSATTLNYFEDGEENTIYNILIATISIDGSIIQTVLNDIVFDSYIQIKADDSIKDLIAVEKDQNGVYNIKSAIDANTSGIMVVNNGIISFIPITSQGVIVAKDGTLTIQAIGTC